MVLFEDLRLLSLLKQKNSSRLAIRENRIAPPTAIPMMVDFSKLRLLLVPEVVLVEELEEEAGVQEMLRSSPQRNGLLE